MQDPIQLLIVGNDPLARAGLTMLLDTLPNCTIIDNVTADIADTLLDDPAPIADVIIWDVGWETAVSLTDTLPLPDWQDAPLPVIALITDPDQSPAAWQSGAQAVLRRDSDPEALLATAQAVQHGLTVFDPQFAQLTTNDSDNDTPLDPLTPREQEVLQHLAEGLTNKAIAQRLNISNHTVKFHVNAIMNKLGAQSRTEAVVRATRQGYLLL